MPDPDLDELVRGTADAAFVADGEGRIVAWNSAAEALLGFTARQVLGRPCHEVLCGVDPFGNRFCGEHCAVARMSEREEPVRQFVVDVRRAVGARIAVAISVLQLKRDHASRAATLHVLTPARLTTTAIDHPLPIAGSVPASGRDADRLRALTAREIEVLRLLAAGHASQDVANELSISLTTIRTHIQNILRKLEVHSQIEAVALAYRGGLI